MLVKAIHANSLSGSPQGIILRGIADLIIKIHTEGFKFIPRYANLVAHALAGRALSNIGIPSWLSPIISGEIMGCNPSGIHVI